VTSRVNAGNAGGKDIFPTYKSPKGNDYYSVNCKDPKCRYEFTFGQTKADKTMYPKGWEAPYEGDGQRTQADDQEGPPPQEEPPRGF